MDKILLFAGTTEGRNLAEFLEKNQIPTEVCVATQYGRREVSSCPRRKTGRNRDGAADPKAADHAGHRCDASVCGDRISKYPQGMQPDGNRVHPSCEKRDGRFLETGDGGCHRSCKRGRSGSFSCKKRGADLCGDRKQRAFCLSGDPGLSGPGGGKSAFHPGGSIGVCHAGIFREESDLYAGTVYGRSECGDAQAGTGFMEVFWKSCVRQKKQEQSWSS